MNTVAAEDTVVGRSDVMKAGTCLDMIVKLPSYLPFSSFGSLSCLRPFSIPKVLILYHV